MHKTAFTFLFFIPLLMTAQNKAVYEKKIFIKGKDTLQYQILYPLNYSKTKKYPLLIMLHGAGERGNDNELQLTHGSNVFLDSSNRKKFPGIILFPQCPKDDFWARVIRVQGSSDSLGGFLFPIDQPVGKALGLVSHLIDSFIQHRTVNKQCVYIGGLSMGAMGTFELLWRRPKTFAAAFAICGGGNENQVQLYGRNFPVWVFHGSKDNTVPPANSRKMVKALKASGAKVKYTEYPGVGHDSWTNAFAEPAYLSWLFKQKRKG